MPMPRVLGISLACFVTSACAVTKAEEGNTSRYSATSASVSPRKAEMSTRGSPGLSCVETYNQCRDGFDRCCDRMQESDNSQFGKAAWYDLVGRETASGEILDTVTATAAHRSLPLDTLAKVTDLDNGCSVIVKINDRGPYTRGRIIDLSPRAAEVLHMKAAGVAAVVIEPMGNQVHLAAGSFQPPGIAVPP
jgi:rare lipoprotein A (peptidoglycan hydrolase)